MLAFAFGGAEAKAHFLDGWLAQCSAVTSTTCTEVATTGYARQPIYFNTPSGGNLVNGLHYQFPQTANAIAGRAVYDAASGGHLVMIMPFAASYAVASNGDVGDSGSIAVALTGFSGTPGDSISAVYQAGASIGTNNTLVNGVVDGSAVTVGYPVWIKNGLYSANVGNTDPFYIATANQVTGFTLKVPNGIETYQVTAAGALATGTLNLQPVPADGAIQDILCGATVTALTIVVPATWTAVGTLPTTCGPNASHELQ